MHSVKRLGVFAVVAALLVVLGVLRPAAPTPEAEADFAFPGGIGALPSAAPAVAGLSDQSVPAIIGTGQPGIVTVFCHYPMIPAFPPVEPCPSAHGLLAGTIIFEMQRLYPTDGSPPGLTFDANGGHELVVSDNSGADLDAAFSVVTVRVNAAAATLGGTQGVNEIVEVRATDETGETRSVQVIVVDTILAFGPTGPLSTAAQEQPLFVSYHCDVTGRAPLVEGTLPWGIDPDGDGSQGLDDMYDGYYTGVYDGVGPGLGYGSNTLAGDLDLLDVWCGGNTASLFDDFVDFQTDIGLLSIDPIGLSLKAGSRTLATQLGYFYPPIVGENCGEGKSVDVFDVDALWFWAHWLLGGFPNASVGSLGLEAGCDANGWRDGVVTMMLLGNGEEGTATVQAQQGGGIAQLRTINPTFIGLPAISLFLESPASMGLEGGEFIVAVTANKFRFIGDETVSCTLDPPQSGFIIVPQTGTTGSVTSASPAQITMRIVPTGAAVVAGGTLTVVCQLDRYRNVKAVAVIPLVTYESESVDLLPACNPVAMTWPDATPIETVAGAVAPAEALDAFWKFDPEAGEWQGHSPAAPEASDLVSVDMLDAVFVCMNATGTIGRPVV